MVTGPRARSCWHVCLVIAAALLFVQCTHDVHEKRADTIKDHVEAFYDHLRHDRVAAAMRENEAIEQLSSQLGDTIRRRVNQRIVDTYTGPTERTYRDQAERAIRDLDILDPAVRSH